MASAPFEMGAGFRQPYDKSAAMTTGLLSAFMPCVERRRGCAYASFVVNHGQLEKGETSRWQGRASLFWQFVRGVRRSFAVEISQGG
jgi:hypothetical protein